MPEEINRILTDALSDFLFVTERDALVNLEHEGISREKVHFVGNVMIDTLIRHKEKALRLNVIEKILHQNCDNPDLKEQLQSTLDHSGLSYGLITLHRPSNVDTPDSLRPLMRSIHKISSKIPLIFPLHPRTKNNLKRFDILQAVGQKGNIIYTEPLGYLEFLNLLINAALVLTDSGGIQEEATFLNVPCITLRHNTERPVTVAMGTNYLVGTDPNKIEQTAFAIIDGNRKSCTIPPLWDGMASERIMDILSESISSDLGQCNVPR
jgi:UDP-N-acetylglucosamine 2-epimerase (non-hydrolysing)